MVKQPTYVILGGTSKAGSGSLFRYLGDHPEICPSNIKETRYYFDQEEFPLAARASYAAGSFKYEEFFAGCENLPFRFEATPDYLYSRKTPHWIRESLAPVRIIFILRDPIARLISWYRFAKQQGQIPTNIQFDKYVNAQMKLVESVSNGSIPQAYRTMEQGRYSRYLPGFLDVFDNNEIRVLRFEDFVADPRSSVENLCLWLGADVSYYDGYEFRPQHRTLTLRSPKVNMYYLKIREKVRFRIHSKPILKRFFASMRRAFELAYLPMNVMPDEKVTVTPELMQTLMSYYEGEEGRLAGLLGRPWSAWR
jgi:hypothetical protein